MELLLKLFLNLSFLGIMILGIFVVFFAFKTHQLTPPKHLDPTNDKNFMKARRQVIISMIIFLLNLFCYISITIYLAYLEFLSNI